MSAVVGLAEQPCLNVPQHSFNSYKGECPSLIGVEETEGKEVK